MKNQAPINQPATPSVAQPPQRANTTPLHGRFEWQTMRHQPLPHERVRRPLTFPWRLASRLQDALADRRSELTEAVAAAPATSSTARVVSRWLADSRWLRVGSRRPTQTSQTHQAPPNPLADALRHLPKVLFATLLLRCLQMQCSSWPFKGGDQAQSAGARPGVQ